MNAGSWSLINNWLKDVINTDNSLHNIFKLFYAQHKSFKLFQNGEEIVIKTLHQTHSDIGNYYIKQYVVSV